MKDLSEKREEFSENIRRGARNNIITEKRRRLLTQMEPSMIQNQEINYFINCESQLLVTMNYKERQQIINILSSNISNNEYQISQTTLHYLFTLLQNNLHLIQITNLLVNLTALRNINANLVQVIKEKKFILINLITSNNMVLIENLVYIMGNICGQDNEAKQEIIKSDFFIHLGKVVQSNTSHLELISICIWAFKNVLLKNKKSIRTITVPESFLEFVIKFCYLVLSEVTNQERFEQENERLKIDMNIFQLLKIIYIFDNQRRIKKYVFQHGLKEIIFLLIQKLGAIVQKFQSKHQVITEMLSVFALVSNEYAIYYMKKLMPAMTNIVVTKVRIWPIRSIKFIEAVLEILKNSQKQQLFTLYFKNLLLFQEFLLESIRIREILADMYLIISITVQNIEKPVHQLDILVAQNIVVYFRYISIFLISEDSTIVYCGVRALSNILNNEGEPVRFKSVLEDTGIINILLDLQLTTKKEVYEQVEMLLEQLQVAF